MDGVPYTTESLRPGNLRFDVLLRRSGLGHRATRYWVPHSSTGERGSLVLGGGFRSVDVQPLLGMMSFDQYTPICFQGVETTNQLCFLGNW